jgi:hypothetical protein
MRRVTVGSFLVLVLLAIACEDIIVKSLADESVYLMAPADTAVSEVTNQIFIWKAVTGASQYHLTIYSPDAQHANAVLLDTVITRTSFSFKLSPTKYEWCVSAGNNTEMTLPTCRKLEVKESLSSREVILLSPAADLKTKDTVHTFWWSVVNGAAEYRLVVVSPDLADVRSIIKDTVISGTSLVMGLSARKYEWCVTAFDSKQTTDASCRKMEVQTK